MIAPHCKAITAQHLKTAKQMPSKGLTPLSRKWRKTIADYYRAKRRLGGYNRQVARNQHAYGVVTTPEDARIRHKNLLVD